MPGPVTHQIFYKQLKSHFNNETLATFPNYDQFNIFSQGHDFLIYHDFYKIFTQKHLDSNIHFSELLQEYSFQEFIYQYLKSAQDRGVLGEEQVRLFIGPGYIAHHILDAYTHPLIIYYAGDHVRDTRNSTWKHGIIENLIDIYLMENIENIKSDKYPVYRDFYFSQEIISKGLCETITRSLEIVYGIQNGGEIFCKAFSQVSLFMKIFKYDPTGMKKNLFDRFDSVFKGTASFSYHRNFEDAIEYLNCNFEEWINPMDDNFRSRDSFMSLYQRALEDSSSIISKIEQLCDRGDIRKRDVYSIIPNIASTHGFACGNKLEIKNIR